VRIRDLLRALAAVAAVSASPALPRWSGAPGTTAGAQVDEARPAAAPAGAAGAVRPEPSAPSQTGGRQAEPPLSAFERVRYLMDASSSMRARFGAGTRMRAASEMLLALESELDRDATRPAPDLWTFGASRHRLDADCSDVERRGWPTGGAAQAVGGLAPRGVSPLVEALERMRSTGAGREAWIVFTDGSDGCGRDPCEWAARALAAPSRPRLYVVGLGLTPADAGELRCLTAASSGYLLEFGPETGWEASVRRLAAVIRNRGTLRLELPGPVAPGVSVSGRVLRAGAVEPVRIVRSGRDEELPGGMYRVVVETVPATTFERVLVVPGGEHVLRLRDVGALRVRVLNGENRDVAATVNLLPLGGDAADEHVLPAGATAAVRAGRYLVTAETGDAGVVLRREVEVARGALRTLSAGGTGFLQSRAPGLAAVPAVPVELHDAAAPHVGPTTVYPWDAAVPVPAGAYRVRVGTLPPYVQEELAVAAAETTELAVPALGLLRVEVRDARGRPFAAPVSLVRPASEAPPDGEALPPAILGTFLPGAAQAVLAGTYDLVVATEPEIVERGVRVPSGAERVVSLTLPPGGGGIR
jgi:hypothetical protein